MSDRVDEISKAMLAEAEALARELAAWMDMKKAIDAHRRAHRAHAEAQRRTANLRRRAEKDGAKTRGTG